MLPAKLDIPRERSIMALHERRSLYKVGICFLSICPDPPRGLGSVGERLHPAVGRANIRQTPSRMLPYIFSSGSYTNRKPVMQTGTRLDTLCALMGYERTRAAACWTDPSCSEVASFYSFFLNALREPPRGSSRIPLQATEH